MADKEDFDPLDERKADGKKAREYTAQYDVDKWYEDLKAETFETDFVSITREEGEALVEAYMQPTKMSAHNQALLQKLEARLDQSVQKMVKKSGAAFIRLSTRSPKDAVLLLEELYINMEKYLPKEEGDDNADVKGWYHAVTHTMSVKSGKEAVSLIRKSSRSSQDLQAYLKRTDEPFSMYILVREFVALEPHAEFRGFVHKKTLTAVSQYFTGCYFPEIADNAKSIKKRIRKYFNQVKDKIKLDSFIIDFALQDDSLKIIELNPFFIKTGAILFDWKKDIEVLKNGPYEFRYIKGLDERDRQGFGSVRDKLKLYQESKRNLEKDKGGCSIC